MPLRARLRRALHRSPSPIPITHPTLDPSDPTVFQPGETMPRPKYRQPVDKKHKQALDKFSFAARVDDWKRRSADRLSLYSPMGSRLSSRQNSFNLGAGEERRKGITRGFSSLEVVESREEGGGVENVGMSRVTSRENTSTKYDRREREMVQNEVKKGDVHSGRETQHAGFMRGREQFTQEQLDEATRKLSPAPG